MGDLSFGIQIRGDGSGLVGEFRKAEQAATSLADTVDQVGASAEAAAEEVSALGTEAAKTGKGLDALSGTGGAAATATKAVSAASLEAGAAAAVLAKGHIDAAAASDTLTKSHGLNRFAAMEVGHSIRATAEMIAAGISPVRAFAMEGMRMGMVLNQGSMEMWKFAGFTALLAAPLVLIAMRIAETSERARSLTNSMKAMGDVTGITGRQLLQISDQAAQTGPFSRSQTFDAAKAMTANRNITGQMMQPLLQASVGFASATGEDLTKVTQTFVQAFADGYAHTLPWSIEAIIVRKAAASQVARAVYFGDGLQQFLVDATEDTTQPVAISVTASGAAAGDITLKWFQAEVIG